VIRVFLEDQALESFETVDDAVRFLEQREGLSRGELEWVRVQLRYELSVEVLPPITRSEYRLEIDTDWLEAGSGE
jgi:hypothetical protein